MSLSSSQHSSCDYRNRIPTPTPPHWHHGKVHHRSEVGISVFSCRIALLEYNIRLILQYFLQYSWSICHDGISIISGKQRSVIYVHIWQFGWTYLCSTEYCSLTWMCVTIYCWKRYSIAKNIDISIQLLRPTKISEIHRIKCSAIIKVREGQINNLHGLLTFYLLLYSN